jgi:hypothetical protein
VPVVERKKAGAPRVLMYEMNGAWHVGIVGMTLAGVARSAIRVSRASSVQAGLVGGDV